MKRLVIVMGLLVAAAVLAQASQLKYGATVTADKATDFTKIKTYVWQSGWDANDKKVHAQIVSAIDKELKDLGLTLKPSGPSDVIVKYASLRRIDVQADVRGDAASARQQLDVGTLVVQMLDPGTGKQLFHARVEKPIELGPDQVAAAISSAVGDIFAKYPTRVKK
ncbi:MAG TPA: DUF4136 domain-containing protein [Vicinamibacterales bacterium]|nr:DUF4136 domain-containing protein [Vicinamibacterales bacterium]